MAILQGLFSAALWHLCAEVMWESPSMTLEGLLSLCDLSFCTFRHVKRKISQQKQSATKTVLFCVQSNSSFCRTMQT